MLSAGVTPAALRDAIAVAAIFAIINRRADTLDFSVPVPDEMHRAAKMLLAKGYGVWIRRGSAALRYRIVTP